MVEGASSCPVWMLLSRVALILSTQTFLHSTFGPLGGSPPIF